MNKLKLGVIGISEHFKTRILLPLSQSESTELVAVASRNGEKSEAVAKQWGIRKAYGSYEELLLDSEIEAVYIPLPNHMHLEWVKKCVLAGKHVICEKPLTLTADETKEMMVFLEGRKEKVMEAFMYRFHPKWQMVRELMHVSGIGQVKSIHTVFSYSNSDPMNIRNIKIYRSIGIICIG